MRSMVDLPQPDGPTRARNAPLGTAMSTPRTAAVSPKRFARPEMRMAASSVRCSVILHPGLGTVLESVGQKGRGDGDRQDHDGDGVGELEKSFRGIAIGDHAQEDRKSTRLNSSH